MDCQAMRDIALENIKKGMEPRLALLKLLDETLDEEQRHFVFIHPAQIPSVEKMMDLIPVEDRPDLDRFQETVAWELAVMASYASEAKKPRIELSEGRLAGTQYIFEFAVGDAEIPRKDEVNWHGQNTSQWKYAGCIMVQNKIVSTHH